MMTESGNQNKMEALQRMLQNDPKALEKILNQITPEQMNAALNIFKSLDPKTQSVIGNMASNLKAGNPDQTKK